MADLATVTAGEVSRPAVAYLARLAPGSRPAMISGLRRIAALLGWATDWHRYPWHQLDRAATSAVRAWLVENYAPATANRHLAALRGVLREAWRAGLMSDAAYHRAADLPCIRSSRLPAGREVPAGELERLFEAAGSERNRAILAVAFAGGLRRSEIAALDPGDIDPDTGAVTIRGGKGRKDRLAYIGQNGMRLVSSWLERRGDGPGSLFGIREAAVYKLIRRAARRAGVRCTPHDLRRTFVSRLLDNGADIATVKELAGHADIQTTARYDRRGERAKRAAAELLEVPA